MEKLCFLFVLLGVIIPKMSGARDLTEKFEFERPEPANALGIFPKLMAFIERKALKTSEVWRINRNFIAPEYFENINTLCDSKETAHSTWSNCIVDAEGMKVNVRHGVKEKKNKTVSYLAVDFKPFTRISDEGQEEVCLFNEVYDKRVFFVLRTFSELPSNKTFPKTPVESVRVVHQHQLAVFEDSALDLFKDVMTDEEQDAVYNFDQDDYYERDSTYECFLAIGSSQSVQVIEEKCSIFCLQEMDSSSEEFQIGLKAIKKRKQKLEEEVAVPPIDEQIHEEL